MRAHRQYEVEQFVTHSLDNGLWSQQPTMGFANANCIVNVELVANIL